MLPKISPPWLWRNPLLRTALAALAFVYEALLLLRLWMYRHGLITTFRPPVPVIAVGNLTVGGAGKTPVIEMLMRSLQQQQRRIVILSRGYGRRSKATLQRFCSADAPWSLSPKLLGDEPTWLAQRHPEVPVYVGSSRIRNARWALLRDRPDLILLDDAYQHLAVARDLNLLLIDAERGLGNRQLLPLGELREPEHHWHRADAILLTKANLGFSDAWMHLLRQELKVDRPIFRCDYLPVRLRRLDGQEVRDVKTLAEEAVFANCGIAQPEGFTQVLRPLCQSLEDLSSWPDHHSYTGEDVQRLLWLWRKSRAQRWVTTEKDAVKLAAFAELAEIVWILEMEVVPEPSWHQFFSGFLQCHPLK